jgi:S-DNA-T family DNA segregation ATPase FtsK/SpoIIIE
MGADKLLGNGDMLFLWPGTSTLLRGQGAYISDDEINRVVDFVGTTEPQFATELVQLKTADSEGGEPGNFKNRDELYEAAIDLVVREGRGSVSLLQRGLGIGYGRAARLIDYMAEDAIVGQYNGSQAREVLITVEQWEQMQGGKASAVPAPHRPAKNKIRPEREDEAPAAVEEEETAEDSDGDYEEEEYAEEEEGEESDEAEDVAPQRQK